jgi:hypothetical protein
MVLSASDWAIQQWARVNLGDQRLTRRAVAMGAKIAARPAASLPHQMGAPDHLRGAYRLLNNPRVSMPALLIPVCEQTLALARAESIVLFVEDTTELNFSAHAQTTGLGPIGGGQGRGLLLHSTLAVIPETRLILGLAHAQVVEREPKRDKRKWSHSPEGCVWAVSAQAVGPAQPAHQWVHVSDRGSDIFEYMATCLDLNKHFVVRAAHNRRLTWAADAPQVHQPTAQHLRDYLGSQPAQPDSHYTLALPAHDEQPARLAHLALAWTAITLPPPLQAPPEVRQHAPLHIWLIRVWEPDPPVNAEPVEWMLLTSLAITTVAEARPVIEWYTCRWLTEDYHQCLKTGCRIEHTQLDDGEDIQRLLGFVAPVAVRLLQLRQVARQTPSRPARQVVDPLTVRVLAQQQQLDARTLTAEQFWLAVARLGGHQGRRRDGPPGWRTIWRGWHYLSDLTEGVRLSQHMKPS